MLIKPKAGQPAKIKVVGVGGGGGNALSSMIAEEDINGVEFIAMNTDSQALLNHKADIKVQLGENFTKGLGSGGDPEVGHNAAEESREKIKENLEGADMIFIACGEGGGTGTGAAPIVAEVAKETGALTVAVVTKPFSFEGARRKVAADEGISQLKKHVDTLIVIPNDRVMETLEPKTSMLQAFKRIDYILHQGVKGIAELITTPGLINVDFADVRSIMSNAGTALMGIGIGSGEKRTAIAIKEAISSPLLETSIEGARGVLFNIVGGNDLSMTEVNEAANIISQTVDPDADIIFGAVIDDRLMDQVRITVIATKFDESRLRLFRMKNRAQQEFEVKPSTNDSQPEVKIEREPVIVHEEMDGEDEFDIPTFLRKK
ncbi:MAG TPA: cell division protein FtsZ [Candidatus Nitrosocosmicus sp.]|nr:cell division protein FtsZ [Candidatus Nitrosocosmicus sp.]